MAASNPQQSHDINVDALCLALSKWHITSKPKQAEAQAIEGSKTATQPIPLAERLPPELVLMILAHLSARDIILAAAHLPKFWQNVLQSSTSIRNKLMRRRWPADSAKLGKRKIDVYEQTPGQGYRPSFSCDFQHGSLYVERDSQYEGFIFAPRCSIELKLQIIDAKTKQISFRRRGRTGGVGSIKLFDLNGGLVCEKYLTDDVKDRMWQYVRRAFGYGWPEQGKARRSTMVFIMERVVKSRVATT